MEITNQRTINELDKVLDVITHDFKIPLTSISFNLQAIKRIVTGEFIPGDEELLKKLECIEIKTQQMARVLDHLIDLAQTQLSDIPLKKNLTHTHDLVYDAVQLANKKSGKDLVVLEGHQQNQYCTVACDKDRLVQVFSNVIHSLAELNPARTAIKLSTKIKGEVAQFFFKNENCAVDEAVVNTIFDKFCILNCEYQDKSTRASLGLALSKWIIEAHRGSIFIESKEKLGTIFTIELPKTELEQLKAALI